MKRLKRSLKIIIVCFMFILFSSLYFISDRQIVQAADTIKSSSCYSNVSSVPKSIEEDGKTYTLKQTVTLTYNQGATFDVKDFSIYKGNGYCEYNRQTGWISMSKSISKDGYSFTVNASGTQEYTQIITQYASPGYYLRGHINYWNSSFACNTSIQETPWCGGNGMIVGREYHTATHKMKTTFSGSAYYGIYELAKSNPDLVGHSIDGAVYTSGSVHWYKLNAIGTTVSTQQVYKDKYHFINQVYMKLKYDGNYVVSTGTKYSSWSSSNDTLNNEYIASSSGTKIDGSGKQIRTKFNTTLKKSGIYTVYTSAQNLGGFWQNPSQSESSPINIGDIGIDEAAPVYSDISIQDKKIDDCMINITGVKDFADKSSKITGSGIKEVKVALYPVNNYDGYKGEDIWTKGIYNAATQSVYIDGKFSSHFKNIYGQYKADIKLTDNVENQVIINETVLRADPTPDEVICDLLSWDYKEPNSQKRWIKQGNTANISISARSSKEYSSLDIGYPTQIDYKFNNDISGSITLNSFSLNPTTSGLSLYSHSCTKSEVGGYKYLKTSFKVKGEASGNNKGYLLSATALTTLDNIDYKYKNYVSEKDNEVLYIDGKAPYGSMSYNFDDMSLEYDMTANIKDDESGVNKVWAKVISKDNSNIYKTLNLSNNGGNNYKLDQTNLFDLFEDESAKVKSVKIELWAVDNVGNSSKINEVDNLDLFTLTAKVERVLYPHEPTFKNSEQGRVIAFTKGYVDKVTFTFPEDLMALDSTLNTEIAINPTQRTKNVPYLWYVPLYAPYKYENGDSYPIVVTAYRDGKIKSVTVDFRVSGTVLDDIRTVLLRPDK